MVFTEHLSKNHIWIRRKISAKIERNRKETAFLLYNGFLRRSMLIEVMIWNNLTTRKWLQAYKERTMSVSCLSEARGDPEKCELEIQNYNNCKDFWHIITLERKSAKTSPSIPDEHERDSIFKARFPDFLNSKGRSRRVYHNNSNS